METSELSSFISREIIEASAEEGDRIIASRSDFRTTRKTRQRPKASPLNTKDTRLPPLKTRRAPPPRERQDSLEAAHLAAHPPDAIPGNGAVAAVTG